MKRRHEDVGPDVPALREVAEASTPFLSVRGITKSFGPTKVLTGVELAMHPGEVIALAGENGAGKSTLLKIFAGLVIQDGGSLEVDGVVQERHTVHSMRHAGVAIVPQELAPVPDLSIYANIFLGRELFTKLRTLDRPRMVRETARLLEEFGLRLDPRTPMRRISTASQQMVEIIKSTSTGCRALLLDEPTSALSQQEVEQLYRVIGELRAKGVTMIYTTHKMAEMRAIADRVIVLRDGSLIADSPIDQISDDEIVSAMIGRDLGGLYPPSNEVQPAEPVLVLDAVATEPGGPAISFTVKPGEIVALAGLMGAGRTEIIEAIFGLRERFGGEVSVSGIPLRARRPGDAIQSGLALVPEDRKIGGAVLGMSIFGNGVLPWLSTYSVGGWLRRKPARTMVRQVMDSVKLKYSSLRQEVSNLSGGNQQKVVLARWLGHDVKVLLLDEPTRGVDVGARGEIYRIITQLAADRGLAILMASSDMPEVIGLAHRIIVMRDGEAVGELRREEWDNHEELQEQVFRLAAGLTTEVTKEGDHDR